ncbi:hypothetical protein M9H77_01943 [Catharanthus roseus]|uniref:Uncharacterized protein n=1 Tax=Catharanthus roseus TaxID=4058 RepID=A0ACC0C704_CATRO|nr:hypothetical protein M9H77_01943 [Catharanthus roseus]
MMYMVRIDGITFKIHNNCPFTIWPATLTRRIWASFVCSKTGTNLSCKSGNCITGQILYNGIGRVPPTTLIEFTLFDVQVHALVSNNHNIAAQVHLATQIHANHQPTHKFSSNIVLRLTHRHMRIKLVYLPA